MTADTNTRPASVDTPAWPEGLTRVPYWLFQREDIYRDEQRRIFQGNCWNYLCLEVDIPNPGDFRTTFVGDAPVVVTRGTDGAIYAFENRCAHRGTLICLDDHGGKKTTFSCVYHAWTYDLQGNLTGVAFKNGVKGMGGMPPTFRMEEHSPRKLRTAIVHGLVFGSFSGGTLPIENYVGKEILARIERVLGGRRPVVIGRFTEVLPNNWKLYIENVKDVYHASILHSFFPTFGLHRLTQKGAVIVDESGGNHVAYSRMDRTAGRDSEYARQHIRSETDHRLADPSLLQGFEEFPDGIMVQILTVFPSFVLQQVENALAVRQIVPRGTAKTDLNWTIIGFADDSPEQRMARLKQNNLVGPAGFISLEDGCVGGFVQRGIAGSPNAASILEMGGASVESTEYLVTETAVRGFWKAYRARMEL